MKSETVSNKVDLYNVCCKIYHCDLCLLQGQYASGSLNGYPLWKNAVVLTPKNGWAAIGTNAFELAQFDNFAIVAE